MLKLFSKLRGENTVTNQIEIAAKNIEKDGFCILKNVLTPNECDAISHSFDEYVEAHRDEADKFLLETNRHSRLCNMHLVSEAAQRAILKERVMKVLDAFFGSRTYIATSLYFEQSSEQAIHRDTPFFHTKPQMAFAGVWFALEDVHPDAGPLRYYRGGHRVRVDIPVAKPSGDFGPAWMPAWHQYCADIVKQVEEAGLTDELAFIRKGDCFIWHPELPHGGSPIKSPGMTRKSMVFHCAPESATMYGPEEFFGLQPFGPRENPMVQISGNRKMIDHGRPVFARNS